MSSAMSESEISQLNDLLYMFSRPVTLRNSLAILLILVAGVASIGLVLTLFVYIFSVFLEFDFGISVISSVSGGEYGNLILAVVIALLLLAGAFASTVNSAPLNKNQSDSILLKFVSSLLLLTLLALKIMILALFVAIITFATLVLRNSSSLPENQARIPFVILAGLPLFILIISLVSIASLFAISWVSIEPYNYSSERYVVIFQITNESVNTALIQGISSTSSSHTIKEISKGISTDYLSPLKVRIFNETSTALELSTEDSTASIKINNLLKERKGIKKEFSSAIAFMSIRSLKTLYSLKHSYILLHTSSERKEFLYFSGYSDGWRTISKRLSKANFTYDVLLDEKISINQSPFS